MLPTEELPKQKLGLHPAFYVMFVFTPILAERQPSTPHMEGSLANEKTLQELDILQLSHDSLQQVHSI